MRAYHPLEVRPRQREVWCCKCGRNFEAEGLNCRLKRQRQGLKHGSKGDGEAGDLIEERLRTFLEGGYGSNDGIG